MKYYTLFFITSLLCLMANVGSCQRMDTTENSNFFKLDNYFALDVNGDWMKYHIAGFYSQKGQNQQPCVSLLPNLVFDIQKTRFLTTNDQLINSSDYKLISKIVIPFLYSTVYPNDSQGIGIISQIMGNPLHKYIPDASRTLQHLPDISPYYKNHPMIAQAVNSFYLTLDQKRSLQEVYLRNWLDYQVDFSSVDEIIITLTIGGKEIARQSILGNSKLGTYELLILNPSPLVSQNLRDGKFKLWVNYRLRDFVRAKTNSMVNMQKTIKVSIESDGATDFQADLGIMGAVYNPALFNIKQPCVLLTALADKSPLLMAGIKSGEMIWKIDGKTINCPADLNKVLSSCTPGQNVNITLIDLNRNTLNKTVILGKAPVIE